MNDYEKGRKKLIEIYGEKKTQELINTLEDLSPEFAKISIEFNYGTIYSRSDGPSNKIRELCATVCLIGQGTTGFPLKAHMQTMLDLGWTKKEVMEVIIFLIGYTGLPRCVEALFILKELTENAP